MSKTNVSRLSSANGHQIRIKYGAAFVTGADHLDYPLGYQDAHYVLDRPDLLVAVVCDGCSTTEDNFSKNQAGAALGAEIITRYLFKRLGQKRKRAPQKVLTDCEEIMRIAFRRFFSPLRNNLANFDLEGFVAKHLTFTTLGLIIRNGHYWFFGCGDGCYGVNDMQRTLKTTGYLAPLITGRTRRRLLNIYSEGVINPGDRLWIASDGLISLFQREGGYADFLNFLGDDNTGTRSVGGYDQTFKPFNLLADQHINVFNDDTTVVVALAEEFRDPGSTDKSEIEYE